MGAITRLKFTDKDPEINHPISEPLFDKPIAHASGGLVVLESGQIAEVSPLHFVPEGAETELKGSRVTPLPFFKTAAGIIWESGDSAYDPASPTIGAELELIAMDHNGEWHRLSPDGTTLIYPDGSTEPADEQGHAYESLKIAHECGSERPFPRGYAEFSGHVALLRETKKEWLAENGLIAPPISGYPEAIEQHDLTDHVVIDMLARSMPKILEYSSSVSEQLNIQMRDPGSALFAMNTYQALQPVMNLITSAAPIRDGSFETTLRQHYAENEGFMTSDTPEAYEAMSERVEREMPSGIDEVTGEAKSLYDQVPYDWRAIARANGSRSGGVYAHGTPVTIEDFLRDGDRQLRDGEIMTVSRTLGWHTDRLRPDKGVIEICNLSHAGHHPEKIAAAEETVIKVIVGLQEFYNDPHTYKDSWEGVIPKPFLFNNARQREAHVDAAQINSLLTAYYGKERNLLDTDGNEKTMGAIYDVFADFAATYAPEPISIEAQQEVHATLADTPVAEQFDTADEVFAYFYQPRSAMTATDALRTAHQVDPHMEINDLLLMMDIHARQAYGERVGNPTSSVG